MTPLTIYKDTPTNTTLLSNRFIDDYMKDANDAQLKIYLYLIRMLGSDRPTSISDIADKFNHTEKDVLRALKYWEKNKLLSLDFNHSKTLVGIQVQDLDPRKDDSKPKEATMSLTSQDSIKPSLPLEELSAQPELLNMQKLSSAKNNIAAYQIEPVVIEKPQYSLDQIKGFLTQSETAEILFIVEQYIGKPLSSKDIQTIFFFYDKLHFSTDLIDYLVQYCVERGKKDFKYIEKVAIGWAEQKITTAKEAATISKKYDKAIYTIMKSLGKSGIPTKKELDFISKWTHTYAFTTNIIIEACDRTVLAVDNHRFEYANSILTNWNKQNVHTKDDIENCDKNFQATRNVKAQSNSITAKNSSNKFNQFTQRSYDFEQLEKELLSN